VTQNLPSSIDASVLALVIPIIAIVFGISVAMLGMWLDYRKKREMFQLHHAERMAAIEKGIDLPPLPPGFFQGERKQEKTPYTYLRRGLMWLLIGVAATAALWGTHDTDFWWGLVPIAVGLAYLITFLFERGREPDSKKPQPPL
jgi:Domain of unknown function (DUF6249)